MKSCAVRCSARFAFLTLASAASMTPIVSFGAPPGGADVNAPQMIDAFEGTFGVHQGERRNHIKGLCAAGEFVGSPETAVLSRSALFSGKSVPVIARTQKGPVLWDMIVYVGEPGDPLDNPTLLWPETRKHFCRGYPDH